jgi:hypothetical protein
VASGGSVAARPLGRRLLDLARRRQVLRLQVLVSRTRLAWELADGADPASRPVLAQRAAQLLRPRYRRRLAVSLERLIKELDADRGWWFSAAIPFMRDQAAEARDTLLLLARALRTAEQVHPRGVAMVDKLLHDPASSPLYVRTARGALQLRAQTALACLLVPTSAWPGNGSRAYRARPVFDGFR